jgi:hypothetical protein
MSMDANDSLIVADATNGACAWQHLPTEVAERIEGDWNG